MRHTQGLPGLSQDLHLSMGLCATATAFLLWVLLCGLLLNQPASAAEAHPDAAPPLPDALKDIGPVCQWGEGQQCNGDGIENGLEASQRSQVQAPEHGVPGVGTPAEGADVPKQKQKHGEVEAAEAPEDQIVSDSVAAPVSAGIAEGAAPGEGKDRGEFEATGEGTTVSAEVRALRELVRAQAQVVEHLRETAERLRHRVEQLERMGAPRPDAPGFPWAHQQQPLVLSKHPQEVSGRDFRELGRGGGGGRAGTQGGGCIRGTPGSRRKGEAKGGVPLAWGGQQGRGRRRNGGIVGVLLWMTSLSCRGHRLCRGR